MANAVWAPSRTLNQFLLCLNVPENVLARIQAKGYTAEPFTFGVTLDSHLLSCADLVLLDVTTGNEGQIELVERLGYAIGIAGRARRILCFSSARRNAGFVLALQKAGARYARIGDTSMLVEAIDLFLAEIKECERSRPCFQITHRFSQGSCAAGEEIGAIKYFRNGDFFQLPLALSARFVLNCLAENQTLALDAFQIASVLSGGWFYRDHARNSGIRQPTKIRVATIKVLVQRIREAMAAVFAKAGVPHDPYEVLQSFRAEGSTRALYRLNATIKWNHTLH